MKPPHSFRERKAKGYSQCIACGRWKEHNQLFHHEGRHWILCIDDYFDYWENTDELLEDYKRYHV